MTPEEIRAEVERRRQHARDLKVREVLWYLEKSFRSYRVWLRDDPQFAKRLIYLGIELADNETQFSLGQAPAKLIYAEDKGKSSWQDYDDEDIVTTYGTVLLKLNDKNVFEFEVAETSKALRDGPCITESVDEITRFIEGPWVTEIAEFAQKVKAHEQSAWKERNAPREAQQAEELRKRFGL